MSLTAADTREPKGAGSEPAVVEAAAAVHQIPRAHAVARRA